jgi:hypothetical protein
MKTDTVTAFDKSELETLLVNVNAKSLIDLQQAAQRFALGCTMNDELWTALQIADAKIPPGNVVPMAIQLDGVARGSDPVAYRAALLGVLTTPTPVAPATVPIANAFGGGLNLSKATASNLHIRVAVMDYAKLAVLGVVVWITAYTVYYWPNPSFGSALDYLTLFLWSLGLTTTGSQMVSGIRRPN